MAIEDMLYPLLGSYFAAPQWVKSSIGKAYSLVSVSLGRGPYYHQFKAEAAQNDPGALQQLCRRKLATSLRVALESVPAYLPYRHLLAELDAPYQVLRQLPLVSKEQMKHNLRNYLVAENLAQFGLKTYSGGSTATPTMFYLHKGVTRPKEYAFIESFHQRAGMLEDDIVLAMRGRSVPSAKRNGGQLWMFEPIKRQLIFSSDHLERQFMPDYIAAIRRWRPTVIQAYPSTIYPLARWLKENPAPDVSERIKSIQLFSENILPHHMRILREVFNCPVLKHYGHSERVLMAASMPDDDRCFFWPQYGYPELVDEAGNAITQPGVVGELVGTSFDNHVMPFIRFRTGDMATLSETPHPLLPGFPVIESVEGRRQEYLVCHDERLIPVCGMGAAHSDELLAADSMQFEQHTPGHFLIKVVTPQSLTDESRRRLVAAMEAKTQGGCTAELVEVASIPRTTRGKHKLLVQHLDIGHYLGVPEVN